MKKTAIAAAGIALLAGCATAPPKSTGRLRIVTTIGVLADWARQVGGDRVEVTSLLTGNESPHTYEIKPADVKTVAEARILFRVGLGMEEWLDPEYAKAGIENLVRELVRLDPKGEGLSRQREAAYFVQLDSLSQAIEAQVAVLADRRFISFHDAWPYFCRRFGLEAVATVEPIPGQEPSAKELVRLVDLIRREHIKVVTTELQLASVLPEMLARETGVKVLVLNPLESEGATLGASASALVSSLK